MSQPQKKKPNTPQKYGHARRIIPIRKRIWQKVLIRWAIVLGIGVACVIGCIISGKAYHNYPQKQQLSWGLTAAVYAFIVWQSHVLKLTVSKEWTGKVTGREVQKYTKMTKGPMVRDVNGLPPMSTKCVWTVEKDDGYIEKVEHDTDEIWEGYFEIGERVRFYKNAKILVKAHPSRDDENLMCPLCGVMVAEPVCRKCGVDFTEAEEELRAE